jgi:hypothetical protein
VRTVPGQSVSRQTTDTTYEEHVVKDPRLLIKGKLVKGAGTLDVINPGTGRARYAAERTG